jgi:rubrerythrin
MEDEFDNDWKPEFEIVAEEPEEVKEIIPVIEPCWHTKMENWKCNVCNGIVHSKCPECGWNNWHKE